MMTKIAFGSPPVAWARTAGRNRHTPPRYRQFKEDFGWEARLAHDGDPWDGDVLAGIAFAPDGIWATFATIEDRGDGETFNLPLYRGRPKGLRGDIDNYVKAVLDSSQGIVFVDDRQVVGLVAVFLESILDVNR